MSRFIRSYSQSNAELQIAEELRSRGWWLDCNIIAVRVQVYNVRLYKRIWVDHNIDIVFNRNKHFGVQHCVEVLGPLHKNYDQQIWDEKVWEAIRRDGYIPIFVWHNPAVDGSPLPRFKVVKTCDFIEDCIREDRVGDLTVYVGDFKKD